ncbi:hypothetical protein FOCC_FOCC007551 [Frankliniella occidentalis]|nr:hypothetical protein FOCC_FOCC007551 [Frankliniella occidentalis]
MSMTAGRCLGGDKRNVVQNYQRYQFTLPLASFSGLMSTPTMVEAPAILQPRTMDSPTPPRPHTAHTEPGVTLASLSAVPMPVGTQHPITDSEAVGTDLFTLASDVSAMTLYSAKVPRLASWCSIRPLALTRVTPAGSTARNWGRGGADRHESVKRCAVLEL